LEICEGADLVERQNLFDGCLTAQLKGNWMFVGIYRNINRIGEVNLLDGCLILKASISLI